MNDLSKEIEKAKKHSGRNAPHRRLSLDLGAYAKEK